MGLKVLKVACRILIVFLHRVFFRCRTKRQSCIAQVILQVVLINNMGTSRAVGSRRPTLSSLSGSNNTSIPGAVSYTIHIHFSDTQRFEIPFYHEFLMPCRTSGIARKKPAHNEQAFSIFFIAHVANAR